MRVEKGKTSRTPTGGPPSHIAYGPFPACRLRRFAARASRMAFPIILALALASAFSAGFVVAMMPILRRYALARPNARSSHAEPTPQGAGLAVVLATVLATGI